MAVDPTSDNPDLQDALRLGGDNFDQPQEDNQPIYRMIGNSKIPVSKYMGPLWRSRVDQAKSSRQDIEACWTEAIRYYENDQTSHRSGTNGKGPGNTRYTRTLGDEWSETENVVFSNAATMLPMLYAKNPQIECTAYDEGTYGPFAIAVEHAVNAILEIKDAPGIGIKSKARRGVLTALLTNNAYMKLNWVTKENSSEEAITQLQQLSKDLENAKSKQEIIEIEGKIMALEQKVDLLSPTGPIASLVSPFRIFVDPTCCEPDHSDANWIAEWDFLPTNYIRAVYAKKDGEEYKSIYEPTHVLKAGANVNSIEDEVNNFSLINSNEALEAGKYGYQNLKAFESALYTKVWYVWDKTTRRVYLYSDGCWEWPLWVWDDPLKLLRFFPYFRLWFHETPEGSQPKGEVTYYLDQQDAINDIHSEVNRMRRWVKKNVFYRKGAITQTDAEAVLKGPDGTARGIEIPEGQSLKDVIFTAEPPSINRPELWDVQNRFAAINRITGINDAQRGAQFKTNTTNEAIDFYQKNVDIRVDEKIDAIEDWLGDIAYSLAQLLVMNFSKEDIQPFIGAQQAANWQQVPDAQQFRRMVKLRVVGGSTDKPTSKNKKEAALKIAQILGQFANAIPALGILSVKALERAYDEVVITNDDWAMIMKSMQDQQNKAGAGPQGQGQPGQDQGQGQPNPDQVKEQLAAAIKQLPPEAKQKMEQLIQQGASPTEALKQVTQQQQPTQA